MHMQRHGAQPISLTVPCHLPCVPGCSAQRDYMGNLRLHETERKVASQPVSLMIGASLKRGHVRCTLNPAVCETLWSTTAWTLLRSHMPWALCSFVNKEMLFLKAAEQERNIRCVNRYASLLPHPHWRGSVEGPIFITREVYLLLFFFLPQLTC